MRRIRPPLIAFMLLHTLKAHGYVSQFHSLIFVSSDFSVLFFFDDDRQKSLIFTAFGSEKSACQCDDEFIKG